MLNNPLFPEYSDAIDWGSKSLNCIPELEEPQRRIVAKIDQEVSQKGGTEKAEIAC